MLYRDRPQMIALLNGLLKTTFNYRVLPSGNSTCGACAVKDASWVYAGGLLTSFSISTPWRVWYLFCW